MKKIRRKIKLKDIHILDEIYPRVQISWHTAYDYAESMKTGANFPPVILGIHHGKYILIDGYHRIEAYKQNKAEEIYAEIYPKLSLKQMFEMAVRMNIAHGKTLSPYEKRKIALKLKKDNYSSEKISDLVQIPMDKLDSFIGARLTNTLTGETIVKSGLKHFAGKNLPDKLSQKIEEKEKSLFVSDQVKFIQQLIDMIKDGLIDLEDEKVGEKLSELRDLIS